MTKESATKMAQVLADAEQALVSISAERDKLAAENAAYRRREECTKVAASLHDKGIYLDIELPELVGNLEKEAAAGRLPEIARAAEMIGPNMKIGFVSDDTAGQGVDAFTGFLVGSVG